jgi:hypothetical protein
VIAVVHHSPELAKTTAGIWMLLLPALAVWFFPRAPLRTALGVLGALSLALAGIAWLPDGSARPIFNAVYAIALLTAVVVVPLAGYARLKVALQRRRMALLIGLEREPGEAGASS